jgi:hypothetical protein
VRFRTLVFHLRTAKRGAPDIQVKAAAAVALARATQIAMALLAESVEWAGAVVPPDVGALVAEPPWAF